MGQEGRQPVWVGLASWVDPAGKGRGQVGPGQGVQPPHLPSPLLQPELCLCPAVRSPGRLSTGGLTGALCWQLGAASQVETVSEENKGLIWVLLRQLRPGMDLSRVVLPTFLLEPRSFLDKLSDYYYHADLLSR